MFVRPSSHLLECTARWYSAVGARADVQQQVAATADDVGENANELVGRF